MAIDDGFLVHDTDVIGADGYMIEVYEVFSDTHPVTRWLTDCGETTTTIFRTYPESMEVGRVFFLLTKIGDLAEEFGCQYNHNHCISTPMPLGREEAVRRLSLACQKIMAECCLPDSEKSEE